MQHVSTTMPPTHASPYSHVYVDLHVHVGLDGRIYSLVPSRGFHLYIGVSCHRTDARQRFVSVVIHRLVVLLEKHGVFPQVLMGVLEREYLKIPRSTISRLS